MKLMAIGTFVVALCGAAAFAAEPPKPTPADLLLAGGAAQSANPAPPNTPIVVIRQGVATGQSVHPTYYGGMLLAPADQQRLSTALVDRRVQEFQEQRERALGASRVQAALVDRRIEQIGEERTRTAGADWFRGQTAQLSVLRQANSVQSEYQRDQLRFADTEDRQAERLDSAADQLDRNASKIENEALKTTALGNKVGDDKVRQARKEGSEIFGQLGDFIALLLAGDERDQQRKIDEMTKAARESVTNSAQDLRSRAVEVRARASELRTQAQNRRTRLHERMNLTTPGQPLPTADTQPDLWRIAPPNSK